MPNSEPRREFDLEFLETFGATGGAFGDPDGKRADLRGLVEIEPGLGTGEREGSGESQRVRVLVGRKGAGKTLYMRRMKEDATAERSVTVLAEEAEQTQLLSTRHVVQVAHWFAPSVLTEIWTQLWNRAIVYSLTTYVLRHPAFTDSAGGRREEIERTYRRFLRTLGSQPRSAFTTVRELIQMHRTGHELTRTLDDPLWDDLERELSDILAGAPPVFFYLDAIDEDFGHAPMYWLRCQKGLFYQVMRLLRHERLGGRLHVVICVRDVVLSSVYRSEHAPRYRSDPHIRTLSWGANSIRYLLEKKVISISDRYLGDSGRHPTSFADWLGLEVVTNRLGVAERVDNYALRHTQLIPRDVVLLGNHIGEALTAKMQQGLRGGLTEEEVRHVISNLARFGGLVQIELCANQLVSEAIPAEATKFDFVEFYTASVEYSVGYAEKLLELIRTMPGLRVEQRDLDALTRSAQGVFEASSDVTSVLWQNGLLGYTDGNSDIFYSLDTASRFKLPLGAEQFVFHPSLHECAGLKGSGRPASAL